MTNPYKNISEKQFWRKSISNIEAFKVDPVTVVKFKISKDAKVATAGSCFAQHISSRLANIGFNYFVTENNLELSKSEQKRRNYSIFSARFGNLYTARQLLQLFEEAFEGRSREVTAWQRSDGKFVDPFRPNIEPDGFENTENVQSSRDEHLSYVRQMFLEADVFIFTLGLTESWRSIISGDVYPLAPGVVAGEFDDKRYEFVNFTAQEVTADLSSFLQKLKSVNPEIKVLLTVSPVPLIATYENRHVLVSTVYSKSALRVAAEEALQKFDWVDYFPSYEIITGHYNFGKYYEKDLREVNPIGVGHAMRCFLKNYIQKDSQNEDAENILPDLPADFDKHQINSKEIICDEESIDKIKI